MVFQTDDIKKMSAKEKADLYYLPRNDEGLKEYMLSNESLEEEINRRDTAFAEGKIQLTHREQLTLRLKNRREAIWNFYCSVVDDEIERVILYYESVSYSLGLRFENEVENVFDKLESGADYYFNLPENMPRWAPIKSAVNEVVTM